MFNTTPLCSARTIVIWFLQLLAQYGCEIKDHEKLHSTQSPHSFDILLSLTIPWPFGLSGWNRRSPGISPERHGVLFSGGRHRLGGFYLPAELLYARLSLLARNQCNAIAIPIKSSQNLHSKCGSRCTRMCYSSQHSFLRRSYCSIYRGYHSLAWMPIPNWYAGGTYTIAATLALN